MQRMTVSWRAMIQSWHLVCKAPPLARAVTNAILERTRNPLRIVWAEGTCPLSAGWLLGQDARQPPTAESEAQPADLETAVQRSVEILAAARWALIFGLPRSSAAGQGAAVAVPRHPSTPARIAGGTLRAREVLPLRRRRLRPRSGPRAGRRLIRRPAGPATAGRFRKDRPGPPGPVPRPPGRAGLATAGSGR